MGLDRSQSLGGYPSAAAASHRELRYERPPLVEALVEFRFAPDSADWDWRLPADVAASLEGRYPKRRAVHVLDIQGAASPGQVRQELNVVPRFQVLTSDDKRLVQLGPQLLVINDLQYVSWQRLRDEVLEVFGEYRRHSPAEQLAQISVRCINRVVLPEEQVELNDYFRMLPTIPAEIPQMFGAFSMGVDVHYRENPPMILHVQFGTQELRTFNLDLLIRSLPGAVPSDTETGAWLEAAHSRLEDAFFASFTERTHRNIFGLADG